MGNEKELYLPDYPWMIIKEFMLRKRHPTAKILKLLSHRYLNPQIFVSNYYQLKSGMLVKVDKPVLQIRPQSLENSLTFKQYVKVKTIKKIRTIKKN